MRRFIDANTSRRVVDFDAIVSNYENKLRIKLLYEIIKVILNYNIKNDNSFERSIKSI